MVKVIVERDDKPLISDHLLLQKLISMFYSSISQYRCESSKRITVHDDKACVIGVTKEEEAIIRYIGGFTLKSLRNRLFRYITRYQTSTTDSVKQRVSCKTQSLRLLSQLISTDPGVQTPESSDSKHLEYSKLLVESLNRGGLQVINTSAYKLFLQIEFSIRPSLSLRSFLVSNTSESNSLLREICENSDILNQVWSEAADRLSFLESGGTDKQCKILLEDIVKLYFKVRKWSFLKAYKQSVLIKTKLHKSSEKVTLHGKDSIRKALLKNTIQGST